MKKELTGGVIGSIMSVTGTAMQTNEVLQTISLLLTILGTLITIAMALINWWKNAKKDGKIDSDEIQDVVDIIKDGVDSIKDKQDKEDKK